VSHTFAPATDSDKVPRRSRRCDASESDSTRCCVPVTHRLVVACSEHGVWTVHHCAHHGATTYLGGMKCQRCRESGTERLIESLSAVRL
jgi:hypothetical protein